jgi:hypothetical protein
MMWRREDSMKENREDHLVDNLGGNFNARFPRLGFLGDHGHVGDVLIFFSIYVSIIHWYLRRGGMRGVGQGAVRV